MSVDVVATVIGEALGLDPARWTCSCSPGSSRGPAGGAVARDREAGTQLRRHPRRRPGPARGRHPARRPAPSRTRTARLPPMIRFPDRWNGHSIGGGADHMTETEPALAGGTDWTGRTVRGRDGSRLGKLVEVRPGDSGSPGGWGVVRSTFGTRRRAPLDGAARRRSQRPDGRRGPGERAHRTRARRRCRPGGAGHTAPALHRTRRSRRRTGAAARALRRRQARVGVLRVARRRRPHGAARRARG